MKIKPERVEEFIAATEENAKNSLQEPGCVRFDLMQDTGEATHLELVEMYRDQAAHAAHRESAHYSVWAERVADMFAEPRSRTFYRNVLPHDDAF